MIMIQESVPRRPCAGQGPGDLRHIHARGRGGIGASDHRVGEGAEIIPLRKPAGNFPPLKTRTGGQGGVVFEFRIAAILVPLVAYETIRTYQTKRHLESQPGVRKP